MDYTIFGKAVRWNLEKDSWLQAKRKISFPDIVRAIETGGLIELTPHPDQRRRGHQFVFVVQVGRYAYMVPFVNSDEGLFLKTIIPSRKATRKFLGSGGKRHDETEPQA